VRDSSRDPDKLIGAYRGLGVAFAQMGDRANARINFLEALRLNPGGPTEIYNMGLLEVRDGIARLKKSISERPSAESYVQLGQLLQQDERPDDALLAYEEALKLNPHLTEARQAIAAMTQAATN
jgi:Flp pilus assembly protein TadD